MHKPAHIAYKAITGRRQRLVDNGIAQESQPISLKECGELLKVIFKAEIPMERVCSFVGLDLAPTST